MSDTVWANYPEHKFAVMGYAPGNTQPECPEYTNVVRSKLGAEIVKKRMESQSLTVVIDTRDNMYGMNPYYEDNL